MSRELKGGLRIDNKLFTSRMHDVDGGVGGGRLFIPEEILDCNLRV